MTSLVGSSAVMALATAMAAVSGTVFLIVVHRQKLLSNAPAAQFSVTSHNSASPTCTALRSCIYSDVHGKRKGKKEKRVRFAEDVVVVVVEAEDVPAPAELRRQMPANRAALYRGIIQDRSHRMACSY